MIYESLILCYETESEDNMFHESREIFLTSIGIRNSPLSLHAPIPVFLKIFCHVTLNLSLISFDH